MTIIQLKVTILVAIIFEISCFCSYSTRQTSNIMMSGETSKIPNVRNIVLVRKEIVQILLLIL